MIACGNVILCYKITGASKGPPPTLVYVNGTINYNLPLCDKMSNSCGIIDFL